MSIYKSSSLAMIPSAYKDGKLYSVRPTDGSGDFTFSRGSNLAATRVDVNGLIEKGIENLLLQSNQFDTSWVKVNTTLTSGQVGYDGTNDAWLLNKTASAANIQLNVSSSGVNTFSYYARAGSVDWTRLLILGSTNASAYINLTNGAIGVGGGGFIDATATDVGSGWYRVSITHSTAITQVRIYPAPADNDTSGSSGNIYIQDSQLEAGLVATDYIETGASTAQAGILEDMPRLDYSGGASCPALLLEPQRTNLITNSEYIEGISSANVVLTPNAAISPEGVKNAYQIDDNSTNSEHKIEQAISSTTGVHSVFVKSNGATYVQLVGVGTSWYQNFNIVDGTTESGNALSADVEDYGNGWYRIWAYDGNPNSKFQLNIVTAANSNRVQQYAGDGSRSLFVWGLQLEAGSYPTSYIPTYGSSVTRSGDSTETATPSTSLFNQTEGVIYAEWENVSNGNSRLFNLKGGGHQIYIKQFGTSSERIFGVVYNGSGNVFSASTPNNYLTIGDTYKVALRYKEGEYAFYVNGTQIATSTATGLGSMAADKIDLENNDNAGSCKHKQAIYFPTALTDTELASLTTL